MEYTLVLDDKDLAALNTILGEMPYKLAAPLVKKINEQIAAQNKSEPKEIKA
jgi:hypothetical protein